MGTVLLEEYEFEDNGSFVCTFRINGTFKNLETGTYQIEENQIVLTYKSGDTETIDYTYESGTLKLTIGDDLMYNRTAKV